MNLHEETEEELSDLGLGWDDVESIQSEGGSYVLPREDWERVLNVDYDDGYGTQRVARDLVVLLPDDAWLSREEYDGSEWWAFNSRPGAAGPDAEKIPRVVAKDDEPGWVVTVHEMATAEEKK